MSDEKNNVEIIPEFKMYITDLETERDSKEINVSDLIFDDYIEFEFGNYGDEDYTTLPYKDFKFFINDYSITIYSPQMKELNDQLQQKENIMKELNDKIEDDKMIIEGNWGCIDNLRKDYNLQKNIIKEVREYVEKASYFQGNKVLNEKDILEILDKGE